MTLAARPLQNGAAPFRPVGAHGRGATALVDVEFSTLRLLDLVAVSVPARGEGELPAAVRIVDGETGEVARRLAAAPGPVSVDDARAGHPAARHLGLDALVLAAERQVARARQEGQG